MIEILKTHIEEQIGLKIKNRGDCELLSNAVLEILDIHISYNTIRRMYNLAPYTKPNTRTLNTFAQFIGYKNYNHFIQTYTYKIKYKLNQEVYKALSQEDEDDIIFLVTKTKKSSEDFSDFIILLTRELLYHKNYNLLNKIFNLNELSFNNFSYSEALYFGNSIGLFFRRNSNINNVLLKNINFINCVYLTFVDYSCLNKYFGNLAKLLFQNPPNLEIRIFSASILSFKDYLNDIKKENATYNKIDFSLIYSKKIHPILCSRLIALILLKDKSKTIEVLNKYFELHHEKHQLIDYSFELFTSAILSKNIIMMKYLIDKVKISSKINYYYQKQHLNSFYLMCMFYYRLINDGKSERQYISLFNLNNIYINYEEYILIFYQIYLFNSNKGALENKNQYFKLAEKLNYKYFNKDFFLNYFN